MGIALLVVQTIRDYYLSGWFQFPLSIYSFGTPWAALDPTGFRAATLGNARNPEDIWGSVEGFAWVEPWVRRLPEQWEPFLIIALALAAVILADLHEETEGSDSISIIDSACVSLDYHLCCVVLLFTTCISVRLGTDF